MRIVIVGTSGCGKTTLGKKLSKKLTIPFTDMDDLYWKPKWIPREHKEFEQLLSKEIAKENFILAGNYSRIKEIIWNRADYVIWLDFPLHTLLWRASRRSIRQILYKQYSCNGNRESWKRFIGKNSILIWILKSYRRRKKRYTSIFKENGKHIHIRSQNDLQTKLPF